MPRSILINIAVFVAIASETNNPHSASPLGVDRADRPTMAPGFPLASMFFSKVEERLRPLWRQGALWSVTDQCSNLLARGLGLGGRGKFAFPRYENFPPQAM